MNGSGFLFHSQRDIKIDFNCIFRFVCPFVHMNYWFHHHFGIIACVHIAYGCSIYIFEFIFQKYLLCMLNVLTTVVCWTCRYRYDFKSILILLDTSTSLVDCNFFSLFNFSISGLQFSNWLRSERLLEHKKTNIWQLNSENK